MNKLMIWCVVCVVCSDVTRVIERERERSVILKEMAEGSRRGKGTRLKRKTKLEYPHQNQRTFSIVLVKKTRVTLYSTSYPIQ